MKRSNEFLPTTGFYTRGTRLFGGKVAWGRLYYRMDAAAPYYSDFTDYGWFVRVGLLVLKHHSVDVDRPTVYNVPPEEIVGAEEDAEALSEISGFKPKRAR